MNETEKGLWAIEYRFGLLEWTLNPSRGVFESEKAANSFVAELREKHKTTEYRAAMYVPLASRPLPARGAVQAISENMGGCTHIGTADPLNCHRYDMSIVGRLSVPAQAFKCKAQRTADPPQDCDWPVCGCDPYADKVIEALQESGKLGVPAQVEALPAKLDAQIRLEAVKKCLELIDMHGDMAKGQIGNYKRELERQAINPEDKWARR